MNEAQAIDALAALGQATRLRVFRMLMGSGINGISAGEIAAAEDVPHNTMSTHLAALTRAGLVRSRKESRSVYYAVDLEGTRALLSFLVSNCCGEHPQLCAPLLEIAELAACKHADAVPLADHAGERSFNVLFLCTANSARSIMAEVILNDIGRGRFFAYSAGSKPAGKPMSEALDRLRTLGHNVSNVRSKSWNEFTEADSPRMDFVIALCDVLQGQTCPEFGRTTVSAAWPLPDPAKFGGNPAERATMFNELYSSIRRRLEIFTSLPFAGLDKKSLKARLGELGGGRVAALGGSH